MYLCKKLLQFDMNKLLKNPRIGWYILLVGMIVALVLFIPMNGLINNLRVDEQKKIELWANAVKHKAALLEKTQKFYEKMAESEQTRLQQFIEAYKIIMSQSLDADLTSPKLKFYTKIIMDNKSIPVIIADEFNNITFSQNVDLDKNQKVLSGDMLKKFSQNKPFEYEVYGMKFKLYYTETQAFSELKGVLSDLTNSLLNEVTDNTVFVPVIVLDSSSNEIYESSNIHLEKLQGEAKLQTIKEMTQDNTPIKITMPSGQRCNIYYKRSPTLTLLKYYPVLYFFALLIVVLLFFMVFRTMKVSEQNFVWIGMSKETAHQLGTPISSLMAWTELLRMNPDNEATCKEMDKDIGRLNLISQRFSQIGSTPALKLQDLVATINNIVSYMQTRVPKKINFELKDLPSQPLEIPLNKPLFEWTLENLIKNSVDAMEGNGTITIKLEDMATHIHLDVSDTGKGLFRNQFKQIFSPGFTTKKRGWGLGLSLVKRIIEEYHKGKIYVKTSTPNVGTTFRIELNK